MIKSKSGAHGGDWRRRIVLAGALVSALLALLLGPLAEGAGAGVYTAVQCHGGHGGGDYSSARFGQSGASFYPIVDCAPGGYGLGIALPQAGPYGAIASWALDAPQGTVFHRVSFAGSRFSAHGWLAWFVGWKPEGGFDELHIPADAQTYDYPDSYQRSGPYTGIEAQLVCVQLGSCNGSLQAGVLMHDLAFDVADFSPPAVSGSGSIFADGVKRGSHDVTVAASDRGGGLSAAYVVVNGVPVASQGFSCLAAHGNAFNFKPCPASASPSFNLDTQSYPFHDGANAVQVCANDFATLSGPNVSCWPGTPQAVEVDNSCQSSQVAGGVQLSAGFADTNEPAIEVTSQQGATVSGRLVDARGNGVPNATLCVRERIMLAGQSAWDVGTVETDAGGNYSYRVQPGPNREIGFGYRYNRDQIVAGVEFRAEAIPELSLSKRKVRNGRAIRLYGSLPGPMNADRVVVFQARGPGSHRWRTFKKATTDTHGRFSARYRFRKTTESTKYRMRAVVVAQSGYPYLAGRSAKRRVRVKG